jgi:hypothetical protein
MDSADLLHLGIYTAGMLDVKGTNSTHLIVESKIPSQSSSLFQDSWKARGFHLQATFVRASGSRRPCDKPLRRFQHGGTFMDIIMHRELPAFDLAGGTRRRKDRLASSADVYQGNPGRACTTEAIIGFQFGLVHRDCLWTSS